MNISQLMWLGGLLRLSKDEFGYNVIESKETFLVRDVGTIRYRNAIRCNLQER